VIRHRSWERLGSRVVSVLDSSAEGPGFKSQPRVKLTSTVRVQYLMTSNCRCWANCSHPSCLCSPSSEIGSSRLKGCEGNCRPGGKYWQPTAGFMTLVTCRLTAKNQDQLRNPKFGNRVWATFFKQVATLQVARGCTAATTWK